MANFIGWRRHRIAGAPAPSADRALGHRRATFKSPVTNASLATSPICWPNAPDGEGFGRSASTEAIRVQYRQYR
jgi:hypothetical protein